MTNEEIYDEGYKAGLEEAWELARKVVLEYDDGGMTVSDSDECFEIGNYYKILKRLSASEAKAKYDAWEKKKKDAVHVGDLIHTKRSDRDVVVTGIEGSIIPTYHAVDIRYGKCILLLRNEFVTTGKHYDLPWVENGTD